MFLFPENSLVKLNYHKTRFILYVEIKDVILYTITIFTTFKLFFKLGY